ncbi:MAG TPA: hypothetical protein DHV14_14435, partial [Micrococcales bacterium]|nr:hypothetical protein [Micrococcales bacterium]
MDAETWANIGLVLIFILVGGIFAGTEIALVSLRESQIEQLARKGRRGQRVAAVAEDPNRFLAAVQIGVTVAGFFSAAYGASTIAPDLAPGLEALGLSAGAASTTALILCTLVIAYLSLVLGELVPKRLALQRSSQLALAVGPPLDSFATLMRPVIWLLSVSTNALVRLLGGDPSRSGEEMSEEELRSIVTAHEGLPDVERAILRDVFEASERSLTEVMRPRHEVVFLDADLTIAQAVTVVAQEPFSRYPVRDGGVDDILGFVHVRDLFLAAVDAASPALEAVRTSGDDDAGAVLVADVAGEPARTVRDLTREIVVLPGTNALLPAISVLRRRRIHIAVVIDEYGGTDGIVTLEDLVEELVGEIDDEHDRSRVEPANAAGGPVTVPGGLTIEDVEDRTGVVLPDGPYETVGGLVMDRLDRVAVVGDVVRVADPDGVEHDLEVTAVDGHRIEEVRLLAVEDGSEVAAPAP